MLNARSHKKTAFAGDGYSNKYVVYCRYEKTADNTGVLHRGGASALYKITKKSRRATAPDEECSVFAVSGAGHAKILSGEGGVGLCNN